MKAKVYVSITRLNNIHPSIQPISRNQSDFRAAAGNSVFLLMQHPEEVMMETGQPLAGQHMDPNGMTHWPPMRMNRNERLTKSRKRRSQEKQHQTHK